MGREQVTLIADILGIVSGVMTILGIGGFLGWSVFDKRRSELSNRVLSVFGYSIKTFLCLVLTFFLFQFFWLLTAMVASVFGDGRYLYLQEAIAIGSIPYLTGAIVAGLFFVPLEIVVCTSIFVWSFRPLIRLIKSITGMQSTEDAETKNRDKN